ncbi:uncharacterized protein LOC133832592 [Humulus lupulus]|uniref:uncharacterized protein LOC133832592 n=1 Tax=Humulus lupulus TaxID=3486 RepID=UPI002B415B5F|nr:uncharacterized protein LOC133832592 [Humulus lupulus]
MASPNVFDLYQTQDEEEVPLVRRRKSARRHDDESSQAPSAKKGRAADPSKDGPSGQPSSQPPATAEKEVPPTAINPSLAVQKEQAQQDELPGARLSICSLRSTKDRLAHILKHDHCREAMVEAENMGVDQILNRALNEEASAMLTMIAAHTRASTSIEQSRVKVIEELQATEARHAGELEIVTQQKDALVAKLAEKQASQETLQKQRDDYLESSRIQWCEVKKLREEHLAKDVTIAVLKSQVEQLKLTNAKDMGRYKNATLRCFYDFWKHNQSADFSYLPEDARKAELARCTARLAAKERARVPASPSIQPAAEVEGGEAGEDVVDQNAPTDPLAPQAP